MSFEKKIVSIIISAVRMRRREERTKAMRETGGLPPARLREARFSDFSGVSRLKQRWGMPQDSIENWQRLWRDNPALLGVSEHRPIGWVLEAEGEIVGFLGNIALQYRYLGRTLNAVGSHGLVVDVGYRALGVSLVSAFYRQRAVDLFVVTTAIPQVGKISAAFKSDPLPQPDFDTPLFWVISPKRFSASVVK